MGSIFSAPKPPAPVIAPPLPDPEDEERERRLKALERRRRGRVGLITTSPRGVLGRSDSSNTSKTLLGE